MSVQEEIEEFTRIRQLKNESHALYLCRAARAIGSKMRMAADRLSPKAFAWAQYAVARMEEGQYPLGFDDPTIKVSISEQLFELLEKEDQVGREKSARPTVARNANEGRRAEFSRVAHYILTWPGADDNSISRELSSTGWSADHKTVAKVRGQINQTFASLKDLGFIVRHPDGTRIMGV